MSISIERDLFNIFEILIKYSNPAVNNQVNKEGDSLLEQAIFYEDRLEFIKPIITSGIETEKLETMLDKLLNDYDSSFTDQRVEILLKSEIKVEPKVYDKVKEINSPTLTEIFQKYAPIEEKANSGSTIPIIKH